MTQVQGFLKRPALYDNIDGVGELAMGFMCLAFALLGWLQLHAPRNSAWHQMYTLFIYVAAMVSIIHFGSKAIKSRITYRRTGFVAYRRDKYWVPVAIAPAVSALGSAGLYLAVRQHGAISTPVSLFGLVFAAGYVGIARAARWKWAMFGVMVAGTLVIAALPADLLAAFANHTGMSKAISAKAVGAYWLTIAFYGAVMMVSGGLSFWLYLRHTQAPGREGE